MPIYLRRPTAIAPEHGRGELIRFFLSPLYGGDIERGQYQSEIHHYPINVQTQQKEDYEHSR